MRDWSASVSRIADYFENLRGKVVLGADGYVDEVWRVAEPGKGRTEIKYIDRVGDFARAILARGSGGMSFDLAPKRRAYGGFTCNTGKAVGRLGGDLTLIGMFGTDGLDPVFQEFRENYHTISVGNPAVTVIYEFLDGKIMYGGTARVAPTARTWERLVSALPLDGLRQAYAGAEAAGFGYYGDRRAYEEILTNLVEQVLAGGPCHRLFLDFGNIQNRSREELFGTFQVLAALDRKIPVTLSLNEHEGKILLSFLNRDFTWERPLPSTLDDLSALRERAGIDEALIHTPFFAAGASRAEGTALVRQRNAARTVITTGAGDNFNGGYLAACVRKGGLDLSERLFAANAVTGAYVRTGVSPDNAALREEMAELVKVME